MVGMPVISAIRVFGHPVPGPQFLAQAARELFVQKECVVPDNERLGEIIVRRVGE
jgi:hypothetical protein